jgi:hypothetical protein
VIRLITADLHLSENSRDAYRLQLFKTLLKLIQQYAVEELLILGDLTEAKDNHGADLVNRIVDDFAQLALHVPLIVLRGNHDLEGSHSPFFQFLHNMENVTYIGAPERHGNNLFLPHTRNWEKDWKDIDFDGVRWIYTHNTFSGARGENGVALEGFAAPRGPRIISGDVHVPQTFDNVTYVGAPATIDFGDQYKPRVLLQHDDRLKSIPVPGPQKRLITLKVGGAADFKDVSPGDILRIRIPIARKDYARWPELCQATRAVASEQGYTVDSIQPLVIEGPDNPQPRRIKPAQSDEQILREYAKAQGLEEQTIKVGLELLK